MSRAASHRTRAAAAAIATAVAALAACNTPPNPRADACVMAFLQAGNRAVTGVAEGTSCASLFDAATLDAGAVAGTIQAGTQDLWFVALAYAPAGTWQLTVTADGALGLPPVGDSGGAVQSFASDGVHPAQLVFPVTSVATSYGTATVRTTLGDLTQSFAFTVATASPVSCILASPPRLLAWAVLPPPHSACDACDGLEDANAAPAPTCVIDVRVQLSDCSANGPDGGALADAGSLPALANWTIAVMGTGGLAPTTPAFLTDGAGFGQFELRGPGVSNVATAVLSYGGGSLVVACTEDGGCAASP